MKRPKTGDVFRIKLENGKYIYGIILDYVLNIYDTIDAGDTSIEELKNISYKFSIFCNKLVKRDERIEKIGYIRVERPRDHFMDVYRYNTENFKYILQRKFKTYDIDVTKKECLGLFRDVMFGPGTFFSIVNDFYLDRLTYDLIDFGPLKIEYDHETMWREKMPGTNRKVTKKYPERYIIGTPENIALRKKLDEE
jgi:hypothetical protein